MGNDDDLPTSISHIVLCCVAGKGLSGTTGKHFIHPGMHANFFIHGIVGILHFQSGTFGADFSSIYQISLKASKYLALPCAMADMYQEDQTLCAVHLLSGVVPVVLALSGNDIPHVGHFMVACNVASMCYYAHKNSNEWGWYTAGSAVLAYFVTIAVNKSIVYPITLAAMEYCAYRMYQLKIDPPITDPRAARRANRNPPN